MLSYLFFILQMKCIVFTGLLALAFAAPHPQLSHEAAEAFIRAQQHDLVQPLLPQVPGLAEHQAAHDQVLALQGRVPGSTVHALAESRHAQAEAQLLALQQQQAASNTAFVGVVGPSGNIGPSGLVGPSGSIAF